jgi:hypothetical protein
MQGPREEVSPLPPVGGYGPVGDTAQEESTQPWLMPHEVVLQIWANSNCRTLYT